MENEALKDYEVGEWILYTIGEHNLGLGEISGFMVKGSKPEDVIIRLSTWTGPDYRPRASDVLCNVTKKGSHEACLIWDVRKALIMDEFRQEASRFAANGFDTSDRPYNYTLRELWEVVSDKFIKESENMVNLYARLKDMEDEEHANRNEV